MESNIAVASSTCMRLQNDSIMLTVGAVTNRAHRANDAQLRPEPDDAGIGESTRFNG
jgi:hypothetical protein